MVEGAGVAGREGARAAARAVVATVVGVVARAGGGWGMAEVAVQGEGKVDPLQCRSTGASSKRRGGPEREGRQDHSLRSMAHSSQSR